MSAIKDIITNQGAVWVDTYVKPKKMPSTVDALKNIEILETISSENRLLTMELKCQIAWWKYWAFNSEIKLKAYRVFTACKNNRFAHLNNEPKYISKEQYKTIASYLDTLIKITPETKKTKIEMIENEIAFYLKCTEVNN